MNFHSDALYRQRVIAAYLLRRLDDATADAFEAHYLECDDCFQEIGATELLIAGLRRRKLDRRNIGDVTVLSFGDAVDLTVGSRELAELSRNVLEQKDSKVVIDMSRVSRIDSTGLGELMRMHSHLIRSSGALKVLNPSAKIETLFKMTRIDSVLETFHDEEMAVRSFE